MTVEPSDPGGNVGVLRFNHLQPPFDKLAVRQAMAIGIDRKNYLQVMGCNPEFWVECDPSFPCGPASSPPRKPDIERARRLLKSSGYAGEPAVVPSAADQTIVQLQASVTADVLQRIGMTAHLPGHGLRRHPQPALVEGAGVAEMVEHLSNLVRRLGPAQSRREPDAQRQRHEWLVRLADGRADRGAHGAWFNAPDDAAAAGGSVPWTAGQSGLGLEARQMSVRAFAERQGWTLVAEHSDVASGKGRPTSRLSGCVGPMPAAWGGLDAYDSGPSIDSGSERTDIVGCGPTRPAHHRSSNCARATAVRGGCKSWTARGTTFPVFVLGRSFTNYERSGGDMGGVIGS